MRDNGMRNAQAQYDQAEPKDNRSANVMEYQNNMGGKAQLDTCLEFIDQKKLSDGLDDFLFGKVLDFHPEWIIAFCESDERFFEWLG